jgi:hypothetical protein
MRVRIFLGKGYFPLLISSLLMVLCLAGCAENSSILDNLGNRQLEFSVKTFGWNNSNSSTNSKLNSRATLISGTTFDTSNSFNVIADVNHGGNWSTEVNNETASYSTANNIWQTTATHYWPGTGSTVDFYAYYPTSISSSITHTAGGAPVLFYTVPDNAADQIDILASSKTGVAGDSYNQIPVDFKHIFAAVQFRVGSSGMINGTITKISLNGIQNTGSYSFTGGWTPQTSSTTTYTKNVSAASDIGTEIVSGNDPFLVMPQTLSNASFTVTYSGGATLTKDLSGTWEEGKVYDYNINSSFSATQDFNYTGNVQSYTVPFTGTYEIECWGASGGDVNSSLAGRGGFTAGKVKLEKNKILYIYIGGSGKTIASFGHTETTPGGYNGGGTCVNSAAGGGGATDIRLIGGNWNNFGSLMSRIMVAGGGGGENNYSDKFGPQTTPGGYGGGLQGGIATSRLVKDIIMSGGTQISGGVTNQYPAQGDSYKGQNGSFGIGGNSALNYGGGGGSGYYGGAGGCNSPRNSSNSGVSGGEIPGSGGSSFISGYPGCNAISGSSASTNIIHTGSPNHYSGYVFSNMQMIAGDSSMPSPSGGTETGHTGNGYARITFVSAN